MSASVILTQPIISAFVSAFLALAQQAAIQETPTVSEVTISGVLAPVPNVGGGAPRYTPGDLAIVLKEAEEGLEYNDDAIWELRQCDADMTAAGRDKLRIYERGFEAGKRLTAATQAARIASQEAIELRRRVPLGQATQADLEAGELKRQAAVNKMLSAQIEVDAAKAALVLVQELGRDGVPVSEWDARILAEEAKWRREAERLAENPLPKQYEGLGVENVSARPGHDRKGEYLRITGQVRNTRDRSTNNPLLSLSALDEQGLPLVTKVARARGKIGAGRVSRFTVDLRPKPDLSRMVEVTFANREAPRMLSPPIKCNKTSRRLRTPSNDEPSLKERSGAPPPPPVAPRGRPEP